MIIGVIVINRIKPKHRFDQKRTKPKKDGFFILIKVIKSKQIGFIIVIKKIKPEQNIVIIMVQNGTNPKQTS